ncbi:benzyl alcohol O-benzoyltransferase-like [Bidens hawaiensis]|uniref:benzyl alcohol O-benzoyltransferase-like n=1 Tax=Bidens hawaiensis TaxID=980011 RepID=UPI00404B7FE7
MGDTNPASVIRDALAKLLVFYYPLAGRVVEGSGKKLMVDCTGEGVVFIEAEADVTLEQFGKTLHPPYPPCVKGFFCDVPTSKDIVNSPLIYIQKLYCQVTRLLCGAFIFTSQTYHTLCDGTGVAQFLMALAEMARGEAVPSISPLWQRELFSAREPPSITFPHPEYNDMANAESNYPIVTDEMADKTFFFGPTEMAALRRFVPENLKACTTFELLTVSLWRCRTIAQQLDPEQDVHLTFFANAHGRFSPPIPVGYYGNCIAIPGVVSKAGDLCNKPIGNAIELVMMGKSRISEEYVRSAMDLMVVKGWPSLKLRSSYIVSDLSKAGWNKVNFGWGEALYAGWPYDDEDIPGVFSVYLPSKNDNGESGIVVMIALPILTMIIVLDFSPCTNTSSMSNPSNQKNNDETSSNRNITEPTQEIPEQYLVKMKEMIRNTIDEMKEEIHPNKSVRTHLYRNPSRHNESIPNSNINSKISKDHSVTQGCSFEEFKTFEPKEFYGDQGVIPSLRWLDKIETIVIISRCSEIQKIQYASLKFKGEALQWWNNLIMLKGRETIYQMEAFKELVLHQFCQMHEIDHIQIKFLGHNMEGANLKDYNDKFLEYCQSNPRLNDSKYNKVIQYIYRLPEGIRDVVKSHMPPTTSLAMELVKYLINNMTKDTKVKEKNNAKKKETATVKQIKKIKEEKSFKLKRPTCENCGKRHFGKCQKQNKNGKLVKCTFL